MKSSKVMDRFIEILNAQDHVEPAQACATQLHSALAKAVMSQLADQWKSSKSAHESGRRACYFSAEFLVGRAIFNNLLCLGIYDDIKWLLGERGVALERLEETPDAALGNGGLGRLAACFLDSAATLDLPLDGYGIRYKFGLFRQEIEDGFQTEYPDDWTRQGDPWSLRCEQDAVRVRFADQTVVAVPYDMPIIGYQTDHVSTLRLWQAEPVHRFDFAAFNESRYRDAVAQRDAAETISSVLYPNDNTHEGKLLRLRQQYFFCSASLQDLVRTYSRRYGDDFSKFADCHAIQLNDTHPVISIAELIRILCDEKKLSFDQAFAIARKTFAYTNHTIMAEALETWPCDFIKEILPDVFCYIEKVQQAFEKEMAALHVSPKVASRIAPIQNGVVHMAHLGVYASRYTNGVAQIHTEILKSQTLSDWYQIYPQRFQNKTNGITQRRWLALCNRELSALLTRLLGSDAWVKDLSLLKQLEKYADDGSVLDEFISIKEEKKRQLADFIWQHEGVKADPNTIFDVQVKRLHEYKRQLLNALSILHLYFQIKDGRIKDFVPTTFLFGAKAAPGYHRAKGIIKLINSIAELIENDPKVSPYIKVVFLHNYNVSYAEKIVAGSDVSEQISTAGTEASGTSNMKFMLNGTVTLGTFDGANIEIVEEAGEANNYIFGNTVEQLHKLEAKYDPMEIYQSNADIQKVLDALDDGTLDDGGSGIFAELKQSILKGADWHKADQYFLLADFEDYIRAKLQVNHDKQDRMAFARKCWINLCNAGKFSSDRTILDYAENIWHIQKV